MLKAVLSLSLLISAEIPLISQDAAASNIEAHVPVTKDFDRILLRDLSQKFCSESKTCALKYELLRKGATQTGITHPKFYAWLEIKDGANQLKGAVRLAAINNDHFEILDFLSAEDIRRFPQQVASTFPAPLVKGIIERAQ